MSRNAERSPVTGAGNSRQQGVPRMTGTRFVSLWGRCTTGVARSDAAALFDIIHALYASAGRHYHTPAHIEHCLSRFDLCSDRMQRPDEVELALWYHDAVYNPLASDNELQSAELFVRHADSKIEPACVQRVHDLIMYTIHREPPPGDDQQLMVDIDLSGFGLPWNDFARDSRAVRAEFTHMSDADFYGGQIRFLGALLRRERFFASDFFHERYERQARENVERTLAGLREEGFG